MKLPGGEYAIVDLAKLRDYCLNPSHPRGRHKARVFVSVLGLTQADAAFLRERLLRAAREVEAARCEPTTAANGTSSTLKIARGNRQAMVRSAWIIRRGERSPRLTSCYGLLD